MAGISWNWTCVQSPNQDDHPLLISCVKHGSIYLLGIRPSNPLSYKYWSLKKIYCKICMHAELLCCVSFAIPWTVCSLPDSFVHGILQARMLEWVASPVSEDLFHPGIKATSPALAREFFTTEPPGKPCKIYINMKFTILTMLSEQFNGINVKWTVQCAQYSHCWAIITIIHLLTTKLKLLSNIQLPGVPRNHCSDSMDLLIRDSSCKWNHTVFVLLWLGLFHLAIFKVYLFVICVRICFLFKGWIILYCGLPLWFSGREMEVNQSCLLLFTVSFLDTFSW